MSKCTIDSAPFKKLVASAVKGAGKSELLLTLCLNIEVKGDTITFVTTDIVSHTKVSAPIVHPGSEDLFTCVNSEMFGKLVSKLPDEGTVTLTSTESALEVFSSKTGGRYPFAVIPDEEGNCVRIPLKTVTAPSHEVDLDDLKSLLKYNKASVRTDSNMPAYKGYYACAQGVFSYDGIGSGGVSGNACLNLRKITDTPIMFPPAFVELFNILESGKGSISFDGKLVKVVGGGVELVGETLVDNVVLYPAQVLLELKDTNSESFITANRANALSCLDRLLIFANEEDLYATNITFNAQGIIVNVYDTTAVEKIEPEDSDVKKEVSYYINRMDLRRMVALFNEENVTFTFGSDNGLTLEADNVVQFIPYMESDEE